MIPAGRGSKNTFPATKQFKLTKTLNQAISSSVKTQNAPVVGGKGYGEMPPVSLMTEVPPVEATSPAANTCMSTASGSPNETG